MGSANATVALELVSTRARYASATRGGRVPLDGISLSVRSGELVCVLGPNGAGKSTLLRVLAGTLLPFEGDVRVFGTSITTLDRREVARTIAVVPQATNVAFDYAVRDVVMMGRAPHQGGLMRPTAEDHRAVERALQSCGLIDLAAARTSELSGGEQKRVAIARALAQDPKVLLLDEPGAYLDIRHGLALFDRLAEEVTSRGLACVVVMHDLNLAAQFASRVALVKEGRLLAFGGVADVMTYARLREVFEADLYVGVNELNATRFFLPQRASNQRA